MIVYLLPLFLLSLLSFLENKPKYQIILKNKYFFFIIFFLFMFLIGLRNQIGCDWESYVNNFIFNSSLSWGELTISRSQNILDLGYTVISKLISYKFGFSVLIFTISILFTVPLFLFCYQIKRTYLSLLISYPYFIVVVGMGPIRQSAAIGCMILSIILLSQYKNNLLFISSIISSLFHVSGMIFISLAFLNFKNSTNKIFYRIARLIFIVGILLLIIYNFEWVFEKLSFYLKLYPQSSKANSAIVIWLINFFPMALYITNISKFNFSKIFKKVCIFFFSFEIVMLFVIFVNNIIAYRFILYCFPISIYIASHLPDVKIFKVKGEYIIYFIMSLSIFSLIFWMKYAKHSYCWLPYQNLLF